MNLFAIWRQRSFAEVLLAAEAFALLGGFRIAIAIFPVNRILRLVTHGHAGADAQPPMVETEGIADAVRVRWAVLAAARIAPAQFTCFPQSLAAYLMLRRRHVASTIVYGVARSAKGTFIAHTWLMVGERTVVGGEGSAEFTPIEQWR
jgi:hypothetical protein